MKTKVAIFAILSFLSVTSLWSQSKIPGDINEDGNVDFTDFLIFASNFGKTGPPPAQTPTAETSQRPEIKASWSDVVKEVEDHVYWVGITHEPTASISSPNLTFIGTAFAIDVDAIATNAHVAIGVIQVMNGMADIGLTPIPFIIEAKKRALLEGSYKILTTPDNRDIFGFAHPLYDLSLESPDVAIIGIDISETELPGWLILAPTKQAKALDTGDEIATLGFPGELEQTVTRFSQRIPTFKTGIISALRPYKDTIPSHRITNRILQHNLDTTPGTSGSPVFNKRGEVIAVHYAGFNQGSLGFAIRGDELKEMIEAALFEFGGDPVNAKPVSLIPKTLGKSLIARNLQISKSRNTDM